MRKRPHRLPPEFENAVVRGDRILVGGIDEASNITLRRLHRRGPYVVTDGVLHHPPHNRVSRGWTFHQFLSPAVAGPIPALVIRITSQKGSKRVRHGSYH